MRRILFILMVLASLVLVTATDTGNTTTGQFESISLDNAEKELNQSVLLPNQFGYGFKRFGEDLRLFFTFSKEDRARYRIKLLKERATELRQAAGKNVSGIVDELAEDYSQAVEEVNKDLDELEAIGRDTTRLQWHVANMTYKHTLVLQNNLDTVPSEAREGLQTALNASMKGHVQARRSVAKRKGRNESEINREVNRFRKGIREKIKNKRKGPQLCIQVITPAKNPETGECENFPTPCDVPEGWEEVKGASCEQFNRSAFSQGKMESEGSHTPI